MFVNNAKDVMGTKSNHLGGRKVGGAHLGFYIHSNLFAQMEVGGRVVTLTDISCCLPIKTNWYR